VNDQRLIFGGGFQLVVGLDLPAVALSSIAPCGLRTLALLMAVRTRPATRPG
jgi:hypothetical protein